MTDEQKKKKKKCHEIIHGASVIAAGIGGGLAQLPFSDAIPLSVTQITMIISLGAVFDIKVTESAAKSLLGALGASVAGRGLSQFLVGWIPGLGNAINASTAAALTETIGWSAAEHFDKESQKAKEETRRQNAEKRQQDIEDFSRKVTAAEDAKHRGFIRKIRTGIMYVIGVSLLLAVLSWINMIPWVQEHVPVLGHFLDWLRMLISFLSSGN